jgi:hypothetical protein
MVSETDIRDILTLYYQERLSQKEIAKRFSLANNHRLVNLFGEYQHADPCIHCGGQMRSKYANRSKSTNPTRTMGYGRTQTTTAVDIADRVIRTKEGFLIYLPTCVDCGHVVDDRCACRQCSLIRESHHEAAAEYYAIALNPTESAPPIDQLTPEQLLLLAWHIQSEADIEYNLTSRREIITRRHDLPQDQILGISRERAREKLISASILQVKATSIKDAIEMISPTDHKWHPERLQYVPAYDDPKLDERVRELGRTLFRHPHQRDAVLQVMLDLALHEALKFYAYLSVMHDLPFLYSATLQSTLRTGLIEMGLYKTVRCIQIALRLASNERKEKGIPLQYAANKAKSALSNYWLNPGVQKKYPIDPLLRCEQSFPEPPLVSLFISLFLPPTTDYGLTPIKALATSWAHSEIHAVEAQSLSC